MNERIREIAVQAEKLADEATNAYNDDTGNWRKVWNEVYDEKFAQLIVRECMSVARRMRNPSNLNYKPSDHFVNELRLHFGIE
jgi:hypothetical protein